MILFLQVLGAAAAVYILFYAMGFGWARALLPESPAGYYAPWFGLAHAGFIVIFFAMAGSGAGASAPVALAAGLMLSAAVASRQKRTLAFKTEIRIALFVIATTSALVFPFLLKAGGWTSFTIGNNDIYDYASTARHLLERGFRSYLTPFGKNPDWLDPTMNERAAAWQIPSMRWLTYCNLSFLAWVARADPVRLYSLFIAYLYAAFLPLIGLLARNTLTYHSKGAYLAGALILFNPHIYYILFNVFMPQMAATGFFLAFLTLLPRFAKESWSWKTALATGIFSAGLAASYIEMFPFLAACMSIYLALHVISKEQSLQSALARAAFIGAFCMALCPYHVMHFAATFFFHAADKGGGWPVTSRYYLLPFQLGLFFSHPHQPKPAMILEALLNPPILGLIAIGLWRAREWRFFVSLAIPFIITGAISFSNDWNYRYFKNFTYIYFLAPLLLSMGCERVFQWAEQQGSRWPQKGIALSCALLVSGIVVSAVSKTFEGIKSSVLNSLKVPMRFEALQAVDRQFGARNVYLEDSDFWETLWAGYFLGHKNVIMRTENLYLRNDAEPLEVTRAEKLVARANGGQFNPSSSAARSRIDFERPPERAGDFLIYALKKADSK